MVFGIRIVKLTFSIRLSCILYSLLLEITLSTGFKRPILQFVSL